MPNTLAHDAIRTPLIISRLLNEPLMIHPRKLRTLMDVLLPRAGMPVPFTVAGAKTDPFLAQAGGETARGGESPETRAGFNRAAGEYALAYIPVIGTLVQRGGYMDYSGMTSYDALSGMIASAADDPFYDGIFLDIDSGGGEVAGCFDLVDFIYESRSKKPIFAFANEHAYSAAYAIASAADKIYMPRSGGVGSVGVVAVHTDISEWNKQEGVKYTPVYAGAKKIDGWPHDPLSESAKADMQSRVDGLYSIFTEAVARNRGIDEKSVISTEAGCFGAADALKYKLADAVLSFDDAVDQALAEVDRRKRKS